MIRVATLEDATAIAEIYRPVVENTPISFELEPPTPAELQTRIAKVLETHPWLVYEEDGEVLGYAYAMMLRDRIAYAWSAETSIYVHQKAHGRGIGRELYTELFRILKAMGVCRLYAAMTLPNAGSEGLHRSLGFQPIGHFERAGYKHGMWHDVGWTAMQLQECTNPPPERLSFEQVMELVQSSSRP